MFTEDDEDSKGLLIIATLPHNSLDDAMTVRVLYNPDKLDASFFYDSRKQCPNRMTISKGAEKLIGTFSEYNYTTETVALTLSAGNETEVFENLVLNKNAFSAHEADDQLTATQNARASAILTTLML